MPATLQLPGEDGLDPWAFSVVMSLVLYDWHRPPPALTFVDRPAVPLNHAWTLAAAADAAETSGASQAAVVDEMDGVIYRDPRPFSAFLPVGYLTNMRAMPGPMLPAPFYPAATFTAWGPVAFDDTGEEADSD
jgi:hypothetical protein